MAFVKKIPDDWKVDADFQQDSHNIFEPLISEEKCDKIISIGDKLAKVDATIKNDKNNDVNKDIRNSQVSWLPVNKETIWIYDWIWASVQNTNNWKIDIRGFYECIQYTVYDSAVGTPHYDWHTDTGPNMNYRKISLTIQLSNTDEYSGGEFELERGGILDTPKYREKGHAIMFPSILRHRVLPVTSGIRKSLVVWIAGPHIR